MNPNPWLVRISVYLVAAGATAAIIANGQPTVVAFDLTKAKLTWIWEQGTGGPVETWHVRCGPTLGNWPLLVELPDPAARSLPLSAIIKDNGAYVCVVRAVNSFGASSDSPSVSFTAGKAPAAATAVKIEAQ